MLQTYWCSGLYANHTSEDPNVPQRNSFITCCTHFVASLRTPCRWNSAVKSCSLKHGKLNEHFLLCTICSSWKGLLFIRPLYYISKCSLEIQYLKESYRVQGNKERKQQQQRVNKRSEPRFSKLTQNLRFSTRRNVHVLQWMKGRTKEIVKGVLNLTLIFSILAL